MSEHDRTVNNLSNRMSIYRDHHEEKAKRYLATHNCLLEKQRQETLLLQQQISNKESKKKSNKTGPRSGSRSVKKLGTVNSVQQQQSFIPEKVKLEEEDRSSGITLTPTHHLPNSNFINTQYQSPEPQQCQQQMTNAHHSHHLQPQQLPIQQLEQSNSQPLHYQQFHNFHNQYSQSHQHPSPDSQYNRSPQPQPQPQTHQFQAHPNIYNHHNHHYAQSLQPHQSHQLHHPQQQTSQLQPQHHLQQHVQHANPEIQYQKPINQGNYYSQEFKELKDEDLACLDNFNSAELPLSEFAQTYEQEIFLDPNFIERFLDNI
ncbi:sex-determining region Y protein-like [Panonychus citri]|uniref:sex-determining region Y protein-like n=1 Tax=Panonychus citri TaxID=50023 RepID=UPI0023079E4D|nr:sex-determining region Y protein-like [Panonychus citri]